MTDIVFGTDGWRGKVGENYTFDNLRRCAQGFAEYLRDTFKPAELARGVVIGHDKRFSGRDFALAAAEVITGNGIPVHFCQGPTPTPAISFQVVHLGALGAVNVIAHYGREQDWVALERWGERLLEVAQSPIGREDREIQPRAEGDDGNRDHL